MTQPQPTDILKEHQLRRTDCRVEVLRSFLDAGHALSHSDIEQKLGEHFDRVTIYRTLTSFTESGLIHRVLDDSGTAKYALCNHEHTHDEVHHDDHVHFKCERCGQTLCLDEVSIPDVKLPKGYKPTDINLLVQGVCARCSA